MNKCHEGQAHVEVVHIVWTCITCDNSIVKEYKEQTNIQYDSSSAVAVAVVVVRCCCCCCCCCCCHDELFDSSDVVPPDDDPLRSDVDVAAGHHLNTQSVDLSRLRQNC